MSANDSGHINNLDQNQKESLKNFWIRLLNFLNEEEFLSLKNSLYEKELFFIIGLDHPDVVLLRWLRARKWNINQAFEAFLNTLKWRMEWGVNELLLNGENDLIMEEIQSGKSFYLSYDKVGRPICYVSVKDHIKGQYPAKATEKLTVFSAELARYLLKYPQETVTIIFDMTDFSMKNMDYQHVKFLINLLEKHYPESFSLGLIVNAPWIFSSCWNIIKRWIDPIVEKKIHFIKNYHDLLEFIDLSSLPKRFNGTLSDFNYIPPSDEDQSMLLAIRSDHYGKTKATQIHQDAAKYFLQITSQWVNDSQNEIVLEVRNKAIQQLKDAYEQLIPHISTRTHYHRCGAIEQPIFSITYQTIQHYQQEKTSFI